MNKREIRLKLIKAEEDLQRLNKIRFDKPEQQELKFKNICLMKEKISKLKEALKNEE